LTDFEELWANPAAKRFARRASNRNFVKESLEVMNLRKHLAGFALFSVIVGCAVLISAYLNAPTPMIPPVRLSDEIGRAHV